MAFFKKNVTEEGLVHFLLELKKPIEKYWYTFFVESFKEIENNDDKLNDIVNEILYFSLWIITISLPPQDTEKNRTIKDLFHLKYYESEYIFNKYYSLNEFLKKITYRYDSYYTAYHFWQKNPKDVMSFGGSLINMLLNQEYDISIENKIGLGDSVDIMTAKKMVMCFSQQLDENIDKIISLEKDYKLKKILDYQS